LGYLELPFLAVDALLLQFSFTLLGLIDRKMSSAGDLVERMFRVKTRNLAKYWETTQSDGSARIFESAAQEGRRWCGFDRLGLQWRRKLALQQTDSGRTDCKSWISLYQYLSVMCNVGNIYVVSP
jgi:hypothetical protein